MAPIAHTEKSRRYGDQREAIAGHLAHFLAEPWLSVASLGEAEALLIPGLLRTYNLRPRDICHLACAIHNDMGGILTNDNDFVPLGDPPVEILTYAEDTD